MVGVKTRKRHQAIQCLFSYWWPKLRPGGVFAGHDYNSHEAVEPRQNWTICEDGTVELGAVKRAVDEFAREKNVIVTIAYSEENGFGLPTWLTRKPF
jgi:hypothetical protein